MPASMFLTPGKRGHRILIVAVAALIFVIAGQSSSVRAQTKEISTLQNLAGKDVDLAPYKNDATNRKIQLLGSSLLEMQNVGKPSSPADLTNFETYYLVKIAELSWPTKETVEKKRQDLKRRYLGQLNRDPAQATALHDKLNEIMVKRLPDLVGDAELPLNVRFNAMLMLGNLDKVEPNSPAGQVAVPLQESVPLLVKYFDQQDLPETLRMAALMGLERQSELQLSTQARPSVVAIAAKIISSAKPLPGFSEDGYYWARKLALQMVTGLTKNGGELNRPETVKALYDIIANEQEPLFLRRDAALALGHLDPTVFSSGSVKPADIVKALGNLTLAVTHAGAPRPDPNEPPTLTKAEDVFAPPTDDKDAKKAFVDGVGYYLNCIATALGGRSNRGLKAASGLDAKTSNHIKELLNNHIDPMLIVLQSPRTMTSRMPQELADRGTKLTAWLQSNAMLAPAPAEPAPAVAGGVGK